MIRFLQQPYPFDTNFSKKLLENCLIGCFIAFFLIFFQPFDTNLWKTDHKIIKLLGYGVISFLLPMLFFCLQLMLEKREKIEENWTVGKQLRSMIITLLSVAFGNLLYSNFLGVTSFGWNNFFGFLIAVISLGIFPITAGLLFRYNHFKSLNQKEAVILEKNIQEFQQTQSNNEQKNTSEPLGSITLIAENEKDSLTLFADEILYIESADNYVTIVFLKKNILQKELLRGALKRFENQIQDDSIIRCHRSFIVNLRHAAHINGNAQGYRLSLQHSNIVIPVARNYGAAILKKLKSE